MEFFKQSNLIRLRSHLDKYLYAEDDEKTVRQSRRETSSQVIWRVELVNDDDGEDSNLIRLKSLYNHYLTATHEPLLLGMTGKKVQQTDVLSASMIEWEPIRDGFQVKLRSSGGNFLRANGASKPWRNTVTHDTPQRTSVYNWILWDVVIVDSMSLGMISPGLGDFVSSFSSIASEESSMDSPTSPWSIESTNSPVKASRQAGMEYFRNAKTIRLKSHHNKYLLAEDDEESVTQDRNGASKLARWTVEFTSTTYDDACFIRLKSCFGKYLTASNSPFLLGMTGRKVLQTVPQKLDSSLDWEPIRDGNFIKLRTRYSNFLRANGGLPPWRNSVTHDVPHRTSSQSWILWDVDLLEIDENRPRFQPQGNPHHPLMVSQSDKSLTNSEVKGSFGNAIHNEQGRSLMKSLSAKFEAKGSFANSFKKGADGRTIYYKIVDDGVNVDDAREGESFSFKGNGVDELTRKLEEVIGLEDIIVCTRSPLDGMLHPLRLRLPPNNTTMHVVVVPAASRVAGTFS